MPFMLCMNESTAPTGHRPFVRENNLLFATFSPMQHESVRETEKSNPIRFITIHKTLDIFLAFDDVGIVCVCAVCVCRLAFNGMEMKMISEPF